MTIDSSATCTETSQRCSPNPSTSSSISRRGSTRRKSSKKTASSARRVSASPTRTARSGATRKVAELEWLPVLFCSPTIIDSFTVRAVAKGRKEYEVLVKTHPKSPEVRLTDVGFGVSQVLPALVQAFYAPHGSTVWMEQPEIHLHPMAQSNLADVFVSAVKSYEDSVPRNMQLIIETHSEHFLTRLQRHVAEQLIDADDVAIYFVNRKGAAVEMEALRLNMFGEIENWPENFFGDEMGDIAARTMAALQRQATIADGERS
ncbi:MAG: DUF3696 domain-containing protein [Candidatus Accumulibacter sp.]|nr:DUF3696 domain-containing protein [Candidatus Accumulibacter propinquus]